MAYSSVHLAAVRHLIIFEAMQRNGSISFGEQRDWVSGKLLIMSLAGFLWKLFRNIISGALCEMKGFGEDLIQELTEKMDTAVEDFLNDAFHMIDKHIKILELSESHAPT